MFVKFALKKPPKDLAILHIKIAKSGHTGCVQPKTYIVRNAKNFFRKRHEHDEPEAEMDDDKPEMDPEPSLGLYRPGQNVRRRRNPEQTSGEEI